MVTSGRIMHHVTKLKSSQTGFLKMTMSSLYSNGLQSPDLNTIEHLRDVVEREIRIMDVQPTILQQLRDAIMSMWTKISEEYFQHLQCSSEGKWGQIHVYVYVRLCIYIYIYIYILEV